MQSEDFKDFQNVANKFLFKKVPFSDITSLLIKCAPLVGCKVSYSNKMFHTTSLKPPEKYTRKKIKKLKRILCLLCLNQIFFSNLIKVPLQKNKRMI